MVKEKWNGLLWRAVILLCMVLGMGQFGGFKVYAAQAAGGTWGTCTWTMDTDGRLTVYGGTGAALTYVGGSGFYREYQTPWEDYVDQITSIQIGTEGADGTVVFPENITDMFKQYSLCETIAFVNVDTSAVTDMRGLFEESESLRTITGLNLFQTENVDYLDRMFMMCTALEEINLSSFDNTEISYYNMTNMIYYNQALKKITFGSKFTLKEDMSISFMSDAKWYREDAPEQLLTGDALVEQEESTTPVGARTWLRSENHYWGDCIWTIEGNTMRIGAGTGPDTTLPTYPWGELCDGIETVVFADGVVFPENVASMFSHFRDLKTIDFSNVDMSQVKDMSYMFYDCLSLQKLSLAAGVSAQPTTMLYTFGDCKSLEQLSFGNLDTANVESFADSFNGCSALTRLDTAAIDVSSATHLARMFQNCTALKALDLSGWTCISANSTSAVMDMQAMFANCYALKTVVLPACTMRVGKSKSYDPDSTGIEALFENCVSLETIGNLDRFNTDNVLSMSDMFSGCEALTAVDVSGFNTKYVKTIDGMFYNCKSLTQLDLTAFNTRNVSTAVKINGVYQWGMYHMFDGCAALAKISVGADFVPCGGGNTKVGNVTVPAGGYFPINDVNSEHTDTWYVYSSTVEEEQGQWLPVYSDTTGVTNIADLEGAQRVYTKYEDATVPAKTAAVNFADLELSSNIAAEYEYTGEKLRPQDGTTELTAMIEGQAVVLTENVDYTVEYGAGEYLVNNYQYVYFKGIGKYCGQYTVQYHIYQGKYKNIQSCVQWPSRQTYAYTGAVIKPVPVQVKDGDQVLLEGQDYELIYLSNKNAGSAKVYVYGMGNYVNNTYWSFTIKPKSLKDSTISARYKAGRYAYTGEKVVPDDLEIMDGDYALRKGVDYTIFGIYDNTEIGKNARVCIDGKGNYSDSIYVYFEITDEIENQPQNPSTEEQNQPQNPSTEEQNPPQNPTTEAPVPTPSTPQTPAACTHSYQKRVAGKASFTADGTVVYTCTLCGSSYTEEIAQVAAPVLSKTQFTYNGKIQKPAVTVSDREGTLCREQEQYRLTFSHPKKNVGSYRVTVTLTGELYEGSMTLTYTVVPKKTSVTNATVKNKKLTVHWKKQKTETTGYQLRYATDKKMKKNVKTVTIGKNKTTKAVIGKINPKKQYYVQIRTYKTVKQNGKKIKLYSTWSTVKKVK